MADAPHIQAGSFKKTQERQAVAFTKAFPPGVTPIVVITPVWRRAPSEIGHIDTVTEVAADGFTITSKNISGGPPVEYFVNWIAMPKTM
jgi:hypothetical protein